jgi:hypothetical protein
VEIRSFTINQKRFPAPAGRPVVGSLNWDADASVLVELSGKARSRRRARWPFEKLKRHRAFGATLGRERRQLPAGCGANGVGAAAHVTFSVASRPLGLG